MQNAADGELMPLDISGCLGDKLRDAIGVDTQFLPARREVNTSTAAIEQFHPKCILHTGNMLADSRLGNSQRSRSSGKALAVTYRQQGLEVL